MKKKLFIVMALSFLWVICISINADEAKRNEILKLSNELKEFENTSKETLQKSLAEIDKTPNLTPREVLSKKRVAYKTYENAHEGVYAKYGELVNKGWEMETQNQERIKKIAADLRANKSLSPDQIKTQLKPEYALYKKESKWLTETTRLPAQNKIVEIANGGFGQHYESEKLKLSEGVAINDPNHQGMRGDTDTGGAAIRAEEVGKYGKKMGLKTKEYPGYTHIEEIDFVINKGGEFGKPGSPEQQLKLAVDAQAKETYLSVAMKEGQMGKTAVKIQDHKKKTCEAFGADVETLKAKPELAQVMVKGTVKAAADANVSEPTISKILKDNGLAPKEGKVNVKKFLSQLQKIKTGASIAPEVAGVDIRDYGKLQKACKEIMSAAETKSKTKLKIDTAKTLQEIKVAESAGNKKLAQTLREDMVDSNMRMREAENANNQRYGKEKANTSSMKAYKAVAVAGLALALFDTYKQEEETAKLENREFSKTRYLATFAWNMSPASVIVDGGKAVYNDLGEGRRADVDSEINDLIKSGVPPGQISDMRLVMISAKTTVKTVGKAAYHTVRSVPVVGDYVMAVENTAALLESSVGLCVDIYKRWQTEAENRQQMDWTNTGAVLSGGRLYKQMQEVSGAYWDNEKCMTSIESVLNDSRQLFDMKIEISNNITQIESYKEMMDSFKDDAAMLKTKPAKEFQSDLDSIKREADREFAAADKLILGRSDGKISESEMKTAVDELIQSFENNEDNFGNIAEMLTNLNALASAAGVVDDMTKMEERLAVDLKSCGENGKKLAVSCKIYKEALEVQPQLVLVFKDIKERFDRGMTFFIEKRMKEDSKQMEMARKLVADAEKLKIGTPDIQSLYSNLSKLRQQAEMLEKLSTASLPPLKSSIDVSALKAAASATNALAPPLDAAYEALEKTRKKLESLGAELSGFTVTVNVKDAVTGSFIPFSEVSIEGDEELRQSAPDGIATFENVPPGERTIKATADGYRSKSGPLSLKISSVKRELKGTMELEKAPEEKVVDMEDIEREKKKEEVLDSKVDDAEVAKARIIIDKVYEALNNGFVLDRRYIFLSDVDNGICKDISLHFKANSKAWRFPYVKHILLIGINNDKLYKSASKLAALKAMSFAVNEYNAPSAKLEKSHIAFDLADPDTAGSDAESAVKLLDFREKLNFESTLDFSALWGWDEYVAWNNKSLEKQMQSQAAKNPKAPKNSEDWWFAKIISDGYEGAGKELDKFWDPRSSTGDGKGTAVAAKAKPKPDENTIKLYRARYLSSQVLPELRKLFAKRLRLAEKEFTLNLMEWENRLADWKLVIQGSVKPVMSDIGKLAVSINTNDRENKKVPEPPLFIQHTSGTFMFEFPLSEGLEHFRIKPVKPEGKLLYFNTSGGYSMDPDSSFNCPNGTSFSPVNNRLIFTCPPISFCAIQDKGANSKQANQVKIEPAANGLPKESRDATQRIDKDLMKMQERINVLYKEAYETLSKLENLEEAWSTTGHSILAGRLSNNEGNHFFSGYPDEELQKLSDNTATEGKKYFEKLKSLKDAIEDAFNSFKLTDAETISLLKRAGYLWKDVELRESDPSPKMIARIPFSSANYYYFQSIERVKLLMDRNLQSGLEDFLSREVKISRKYLDERKSFMEKANKLIADTETLAKSLPSDQTTKGDFQAKLQEAFNYAFYFKRLAFASKEVTEDDFKEFTDNTGKDTAFISKNLKILDDLRAKKELFGDMLETQIRVSNNFSKALNAKGVLARLSRNIQPFPQMQKAFDLITKISQADSARYLPQYQLPMSGSVLRGISKLGSTPAERMEKILALNKETIEFLGKTSPCNSPENLEKFYRDAELWFGKMPDIPNFDCLKARGELYRRTFLAGAPAAYRTQKGLPPGPQSILFNGREIPYDGSVTSVRFSELQPPSKLIQEAYQKSGVTDEIRSYFLGAKQTEDHFRVEFSFYDSPFVEIQLSKEYKPMEFTITDKMLPLIVNVKIRNVSQDGFLDSSIPGEPPKTIVILP